MKSLGFLLVVVGVTVAGTSCSTSRPLADGPPPRPLGGDLPAYQTPGAPEKVKVSPGVWQEPSAPLALRDAWAAALMHNPGLAAFSWELRAAEARLLQESLLPNPEIEWETEGVGGQGEYRGTRAAESTLAVSQALELGGKRPKRTQVALRERELAGWDYQRKRLDLLTEVTQAFLDVLAAQERLAVVEERVGVSQQVLGAVAQRVEAGKDSALQKTKAQVALSQARIERQQIGQELESARRRLAGFWGGRAPVFERATGRFYEVLSLPSEGVLWARAVQNPDLARWDTEMDRQRAALALAQARGAPDVSVSAGLKQYNETDDRAFMLGLSVPLPLFDRNQGGVLEAKCNLVRAELERQDAEASLYRALAETYGQLCNAYTEAVGLRDEVVPGAEGAFAAATEEYGQGKLDYLGLLDAQQTLFETRAQYIDALASYHKAKAEVERIVGQAVEDIQESGRQ